MKKIWQDRNGFSLIEIIVSVALLGIVLVPFSTMFSTALRMNMDADRQLEANQLAQQYIEQMLHTDTFSPKVEINEFEVYCTANPLDENNDLVKLTVTVKDMINDTTTELKAIKRSGP